MPEPLTPAEKDRLAALRAHGDQIEAEFPGVKTDFVFMDDAEVVDRIAAEDAMLFTKAAGFGVYQPQGMPPLASIELDGPDWLDRAVRAHAVTCDHFGIGNQIESVDVPLFALLRLRVNGREAPININIADAPAEWLERAMHRFCIVFPPDADGVQAWMATGAMHRFDQPTVVPAKLGRNSLCPCQSGLKFKRCHGR